MTLTNLIKAWHDSGNARDEREVLADYLEEHGREEDAETLRKQTNTSAEYITNCDLEEGFFFFLKSCRRWEF